jgi:hypothetical protein
VKLLTETATHHAGALILCALILVAVTALVVAVLSARLAPLVAQRHAITRRVSTEFGRVKVVASEITPDMQVPALDGIEHHGDFECGHIAGVLFEWAVATGALAAPDGVRIECYPDRDIETGGFVLVAFPAGEKSSWGVSTGYHKASVIGIGDGLDTSERQTVIRALEVFARELNSALSGLERRRWHAKPGSRAGWGIRRADRHQAPAPSPRASQPQGGTMHDQPPVLAVADAHECVQLILDETAVAAECEIPGLTCALECLLSLDERDAAQLVAQVRQAA